MPHTPKHRSKDSDATVELRSSDATVELDASREEPPAGLMTGAASTGGLAGHRLPGHGLPAGPVDDWPAHADPAEEGFAADDPLLADELLADELLADELLADDPVDREEPDGGLTGPGSIDRPPRPGARAIRAFFRTSGELLITLGVVVLLFVGYQLYGRTGMINDHQRDLDRQLQQSWAGPKAPPSPGPSAAAAPAAPLVTPAEGDSIGRLYVPKLDLQWVVVQGISLDDLRYAPGHYPGTALPGQVGNFAMAGHRERGMFWDLDQLQSGDLLIMETAATWYVYRIFENHIVTPHSMEVIAPVPNQPGAAPTEQDITLTTCNPKWDNYQRLVVHGALIRATPHDVRPPELGG